MSPEVLEAAAHADFLATADPVGLYTEAAPRQAAAAPSRRTQAHSLSARRLRLASIVVLAWCCSVWPSPTRSECRSPR